MRLSLYMKWQLKKIDINGWDIYVRVERPLDFLWLPTENGVFKKEEKRTPSELKKLR